MRKVYMKYLLLKVKMKISFSALLKNMTIKELWMTQILNSFKYLRDSGQLLVKEEIGNKDQHEIFKSILRGEIDFCLKLLIKYNLDKQLKHMTQEMKNEYNKLLSPQLVAILNQA